MARIVYYMARDQKIESGDLELNKYTVTVYPASHDMGISLHYNYADLQNVGSIHH